MPDKMTEHLFGGSRSTYLVSINNFFAKESILSSVFVQQAPIHFYVPRECVAGGDNSRDDPEVEESVALDHLVTVLTCTMLEENAAELEIDQALKNRPHNFKNVVCR